MPSKPSTTTVLLVTSAILSGLVSGPSAAQTTAASSLPSVECLKALRSARVKRMLEDADGESAALTEAQGPCGERTELLTAMLDFDRRIGLSPEERQDFHDRLLAQLTDPGAVSEAVAAHLIYETDLETEVLEAVAESYLKRLDKLEQPPMRELRQLADLLERLGRLEEAATTLERLSRIERGETSDWRLIGLYQRLKRWPEVAKALRRVVDRGPLQARLFRPALIQILARLGDLQEARAQLEMLEAEAGQALPEQAVLASFYLDLAWEFRDAGHDEDAERMFRRALHRPERTAPALAALQSGPGNATQEAAQALFHFYAAGDEREELRALFSPKTDTEDPFSLFEAATQRLTSREYEEAYELLRRAAPALGDLEAAWYNLGLAAYRIEEWEEAARAYEKSNELNPERSDSWFFRGLALVNLERFEVALLPLERALELDPTRDLAHYHLWRAYTKLGRSQDAQPHREAWDRAQSKKQP